MGNFDRTEMHQSKRLKFLKSFLRLYKVNKIELIKESNDFIRGIAIYDQNDPEERQEFIWYKTEDETPSPDLSILIDKIISEKWHDGDKIFKQIQDLEIAELQQESKENALNELFDIEIKMIDNGEETDTYFVHY